MIRNDTVLLAEPKGTVTTCHECDTQRQEIGGHMPNESKDAERISTTVTHVMCDSERNDAVQF